MSQSNGRKVASLLSIALLVGCTGQIFDAGSAGPRPDEGGGAGPGPAHKSGIPETNRTLRLSHAEYDNTLHDLLGLPADETFTVGFVDDTGEGSVRSLDARLASAYQGVAERLAERVTASEEAATGVLSCDPVEGTTCRARFLEEIGLRAFRRPLTTVEADTYGALFDMAPELYAGMTPFMAGVRAVLEAMLQSPHFLYRVEWSDGADDDGVVALDGYDIANRLSYLLWRSMPDEALFAAAAAGELDTEEGVALQAYRMLEDPRARAMVQDFHAHLLELERYRDLTRDPEISDTFDADTTDAMQAEVRLFVDDVFTNGGGFYELMTENVSFVDADLAALYGIDGTFGDELTRVELDPTQRAGLLTQVGFLAVNADYGTSDPIHRGLFINQRILCNILPPPPAGVDATLDPISTTKRAQVEAGTMQEGSTCAGCHATINPPGFALESYGALGQFRTEENGNPVDSSTELLIDGRSVAIDGGVDLANAIAESDAASECYVKHWVEFAFARMGAPEDDSIIDELGARMADRSLSIRDLLVELATTRSFRYRRDEP